MKEIVQLLERWQLKEAEARMSSDNPSTLAAAEFYESAIKTYREIPRANAMRHKSTNTFLNSCYFTQNQKNSHSGK